jgi:hypothetical protein
MGKFGKFLVIWGVIWLVIAGVVYIFWGQKQPDIIYGVGLAAFISLVFMFKMLWEKWEGEIVELKTEKVAVNSGDDTIWEDVLFAKIKLKNGKTKKIRAARGMQIGDYLVKERGEGSYKIRK